MYHANPYYCEVGFPARGFDRNWLVLRHAVTLLMWSRESAPMQRYSAAPNLFTIAVWNW
jgi:hypothetical protein